MFPLVSTQQRIFVSLTTNSVIVYNVKAYLPDFLIPQYDILRDTLLSGLQLLGIVKGSSTAASGEPSHDWLYVYT